MSFSKAELLAVQAVDPHTADEIKVAEMIAKIRILKDKAPALSDEAVDAFLRIHAPSPDAPKEG